MTDRAGAPAGRPPTPVPPSTDEADGGDAGAWHEDPWDAAPDVDEVEALRPERHVAKWVSFGALALVNVLIIAAGFAGWWYVRQANPSGGVGAPVAVQVADGETLHDLSVQLEGLGIVQSAVVLPPLRRRPRRADAGARSVQHPHRRPRRQRAAPAAHAAERDDHPGDVPGGLHAAPDGGAPRRQDPAVRRRLVPADRHHRHVDRLGVPRRPGSPRSRACCSPPPTTCPTPTPSDR